MERVSKVLDSHLERKHGIQAPDQESFKALFRQSMIPFLLDPKQYQVQQRSIITGATTVDYDFYQ